MKIETDDWTPKQIIRDRAYKLLDNKQLPHINTMFKATELSSKLEKSLQSSNKTEVRNAATTIKMWC